MKKFRNLKLLGLVGVIVLTLVFVGINVVQAQVKTKGKPPWAGKAIYTWEVRILPGGNLEGVGARGNVSPGWLYEDSESNVVVDQFIQTYISRVHGTWYTPTFRFEVLNPVKIRFQGIVNIPVWDGGEPGVKCGFPEGKCLFVFLNDEHPMAGYQRVYFLFRGKSVQDLWFAEIDNMGVGETRRMCLYFSIEGQVIYKSCGECNPENYHNVRADAHGYYNNMMNQFDIYFKRESTDVWKIVVDTDFNNPAYTPVDYKTAFDYCADRIYEEYCDCIEVPINKKKTKLKKEIYRPYWGRGNMAFQIEFIRTKKGT